MSLAHALQEGIKAREERLKSTAEVVVDETAFYYCDSCARAVQTGDPHYHCWDCPNYDWCKECYATKKHEHPMWCDSDKCLPNVDIKKDTVAASILNMFDIYANRPCLGFRAPNPSTASSEKEEKDKEKEAGDDTEIKRAAYPLVGRDGFEYGGYVWITYDQVRRGAMHIGSGLLSVIKPRDFIGICGKNQLEWFMTDYACFIYGIVTVSVHTTLDQRSLNHLINNAQLRCVVCDVDVIDKFFAASKDCPTLEYIVLIGNKKSFNRSFEVPESVTLLYWDDIYTKGKENHIEPTYTAAKDDIVTLIYTSGSTGDPKGAIITDHILNTDFTAAYSAPEPFVQLSFAPLAHSERIGVLMTLSKGGRVGVYSGRMDLLFEEFQMVRPTLISAVPRLYNKLYAEYQEALAAAKAAKPDLPHYKLDQEVLKKFRPLLGGRTQMLITGGAPTGYAVLKFLGRCFNCAVYNGYGATECGPITTGVNVHNNVEVRLVDVPEMGYLSTDFPNPRGEICVKSALVIPGYYRNPEETKKSIEDGWFHTGDIGMFVDGTLHVIDRKKNIFKLAQGEYVAPERLESIYNQADFVNQILIHGDTMKDYVVAVVVPNRGKLRTWALENLGIKEGEVDYAALCENPKVKDAVLQEIAAMGKSAGVASYEVPRGVILDIQNFTEENRRMTASNKLCRRVVEQDYKEKIEQLYKEIDADLIDTRSKVSALFEQTLGKGDNQQHTLMELGGDSLSAVKIAQGLSDMFKVEVSVDVLFGQSATVEDVARLIDQSKKVGQSEVLSRTGGLKGGQDTADTPLPPQAKSTAFVDYKKEAVLRLDKEASFKPLKEKEKEGGGPTFDYKNIFLTGCTGFLGPFLLEQLLTQCPEALIHCLIRAADAEEGKKRILSGMAESQIIIDEEKAKRIIAVAGDLAKPSLGLSEEEFNTIARNVDAIFHSGAYVHGVLPYYALRAPNVDGTHEVLRMATLTEGGSPVFHYVSTVSVFDASRGIIREDAELAGLVSRVPYYSGYSQSKWVAEMMVTEARAKGLPVVIYRPGTISGHTKTGASNKNDFVNRVLCGIAQLGAYPEAKASINLAPVDYVASAIVTLGRQKASLGEAYHLVHPKSVDFASAVDWISSWMKAKDKGTGLESLPYREWLRRMKQDKDNVLWPLLSSFKDREDGFPLTEDTVFACAKCVKALRAISASAEEKCSASVEPGDYAITEEVFHRYMDFFDGVGFFGGSGGEKQ